MIRGNTSEDDCTLTALPRRKHEDGSFSYRGVVFENNVSRNCAYGLSSATVSALSCATIHLKTLINP
ncbi:MAG: hypothetical protein ACLR23_28180 [Clostridia bacterium]